MGNLLARLKRIRFVYRRSSSFTKTVILSAVVLGIASLLILGLTIESTRARNEALNDQAAQLEQEKDRLEDKVDSLGSADSVEDIAKDELGMVPSDAVVIVPTNP